MKPALGSDLYSVIQSMVRHELESKRFAEIGQVTDVFSHASGSDKNNYTCDVVLRDSGLELKKVPVTTQRIGMAAIPNVGDLVLVQFIRGEVHGAIITGRLYNDEDRPPEADKHELVYVCPDAAESGVRRFYFEFPNGNTFTLDDDKLEIVIGDTIVAVNNGADVEITSSGKLKVECDGGISLSSQGDITLDAGGKIELTAQTDLKMEGLSASVKAQTSAEIEGAASAKLKGGTISIAGMTDFSPA